MLSRAIRSLCAAICLCALPALAGGALELALGTATAGGGFELYGATLARVLAEVDPQLVVRPRQTAGSLENIALLRTGALDMALVQGDAAGEALAGPGDTEQGLRIVAAMYPTAGMFVVRADSPYRSIEDLRGQAVAFGARGSGLVTLARRVLEGIGLDMERDFVPILLDRAGDGPGMLRDGRVAALWGGGSGWPVFTAAMTAPGGGRFIAPDRAQIERIRARHPVLQVQTLPANSYPGQTAPIESVGSWSLILARPGLDAEAVRRFCRALQQGQERFAALLSQARETTARNTLAAAARHELLHPGARRCLVELGVAP